MRWPGHIQAGTSSSHLCAHYDALATIAELSGAPLPKRTDGISYLPTLLDTGKQRIHDYLFWDFAGYGGQLAVRMGDWKGLRKNLKKDPAAPFELYNLRSDRAESVNVAEQNPQIASRLKQILVDGREQPIIERFRFGEYR